MDELGTRMKEYESKESGRRFLPMLPVVARIDGKNFSKFTKGFKRPYDDRMVHLMLNTTIFLVEKTQALIGYTQSDEISLVWYSDSYKSQIFFDGRIQKMTSVLASMATSFFNENRAALLPERENTLAFFDCRVWQVPNKAEAVNNILWREIDATKNSVSMAARCYYSHKDLHNKGRADMMDMMMEKGVNWNNYPTYFKRGMYIQKQKITRKFTDKEIEKLPKKHEARTNPDLKVERTEVRIVNMPPISKVINRVGVIFNGETPKVES
jgi:tRNA(His) guanylyltransferase